MELEEEEEEEEEEKFARWSLIQMIVFIYILNDLFRFE